MEQSRSVRQDLQARSFRFSCDVVALYKQLVRKNVVPRGLLSQLLAAATSVGANMEEAASAQSMFDLRAKYAIALKEARETRYWLRLLTETHCLARGETAPLLAEVQELIAILTACVRRIRPRN